MLDSDDRLSVETGKTHPVKIFISVLNVLIAHSICASYLRRGLNQMKVQVEQTAVFSFSGFKKFVIRF